MTGEASGIDEQTILSHIAVALLVIDADETILYANPMAEHLIAASQTSLYRQSITFLGHYIHSLETLLTLLDKVRQTARPLYESDCVLQFRQTGDYHCALSIVPLQPEARYLICMTPLYTVPNSLPGTQAPNKNKFQFGLRMSQELGHEIKNPLAGIRGAAQLLEPVVTEVQNKDLLQLIIREADHIAALVDKIGILGDGLPLDLTQLNIHEILEQVKQAVQAGFASHIRFIESYDPSLPMIWADRARLSGALLNLVKNSAEALENHTDGTITLSTSYSYGQRLTDGFGRHLPLVVTISDNGGGIAPEIMPFIFDPFITSKLKGSGIGLTVAAQVIREHGGILTARCQHDETIMRIMLPLDKAEQPSL